LQRDEDPVVDAVLLEELGAQQLEVAAREAAVRPRVDAIAELRTRGYICGGLGTRTP